MDPPSAESDLNLYHNSINIPKMVNHPASSPDTRLSFVFVLFCMFLLRDLSTFLSPISSLYTSLFLLACLVCCLLFPPTPPHPSLNSVESFFSLLFFHLISLASFTHRGVGSSEFHNERLVDSVIHVFNLYFLARVRNYYHLCSILATATPISR